MQKLRKKKLVAVWFPYIEFKQVNIVVFLVSCIAFHPCKSNKLHKLLCSKNLGIYINLPKWTYIGFKLFLIDNSPSFLSLSSPPPAAGVTIMPEISVVEDQGQVVGVIAVIFCGDADTRTPFQGGEKGGGDAIDEPHSHPVELPAGGWGSGGRGSDLRVVGSRPEIEEAGTGGGGSGSHGMGDPHKRRDV